MRNLAILPLLLALSGCATTVSDAALSSRSVRYTETCQASVYASGSKLATGERYYPRQVLIAHRTAALYSWVRVTNLRNGMQIVTQVRDRGPYAMKHKRCVDLSLGTSHALDFPWGVGMVRVEHLTK